jgi:hypothetical protein
MAHTNTTGAAVQDPSNTSTQSGGGSIGASLIPAKSMTAGYQGCEPLDMMGAESGCSFRPGCGYNNRPSTC